MIGTGPTVRYSAMPEMFEALMYAARRELVITTPYYVPDEPIQAALCASARRGVATTVVFPARNDSWIVAAASRSYYAELLDAGVRIFEYDGGLLHTKSLTLDGEVTLIGSANIDRRSFDLNFENNILFFDAGVTDGRPRTGRRATSPTRTRSRPPTSPPGAPGGGSGTTRSPCSARCSDPGAPAERFPVGRNPMTKKSRQFKKSRADDPALPDRSPR